MFNYKLLCGLLLLVLSFGANAKRFASGYTEFELPPGWECFLEGTEYVCQSENADRKKEAIIILAAKKRGNQDTLVEYKKYLQGSRTYTLPGNKKQVSEPKSVKQTRINNHQWVDALHLASEVPGFYTRYLATVKAGIGVAVTLSVTKNMYEAYKGIFDKVIASLRVFAQENIDVAGLRNSGKKDGSLADATFVDQDEVFDTSIPKVKRKKQGSGSSNDFLFLIVLVIVGVMVVLRMKAKKKGKTAAKKKKKKKE